MAILPLPNTQHLISSPYLDPNLFNIDERILFQIEKGRFQLDQPLKYYLYFILNYLKIFLEFIILKQKTAI